SIAFEFRGSVRYIRGRGRVAVHSPCPTGRAMSEPIKHLACPVVVIRLAVAELKGDDLADEVREQLLVLYHRTQAENVVVDFRGVTYLSSAGFRPLLSLQRAVRERG